MGTSAIDAFAHAPAVPPLRGDLRKKGSTAAGDPTPPTGHRDNIAQEKLGAAHVVAASTPPMTDPSAGATQANGHIIPSAIRRGDSFVDGGSGARAGY
jgi:hypothetical protein